MTDPIERLRAANPVPSCPRRPVEELWRRLASEFGPAAPVHRRGSPAARTRRAWLPSIGGVMVAVSATVAVGIAVLAIAVLGHGRSSTTPTATAPVATSTGASGVRLPLGSEIRGPVAAPNTGPGAPVPSTVRLVVQTRDPAGGPPWGMRAFQTTRGQTCVQAGRVQDQTIGVIGQDGALGNDHHFHPMPPSVLVATYCSETDRNGRAFENVTQASVSASGGTTVTELDGHGCGISGTHGHPCRRSDLRVLQYGLLGPDAVSIAYHGTDGRSLTRPTAGQDGAYLIVEHATPRLCRTMWRGSGCDHTAPGGYSFGPTLQAGLVTAVRYHDGHICHVPPPPPPASPAGTPQGSCPVVGYLAPRTGHLSASLLAAPITARKLSSEPVVDISFTARVAVTNDNSYYQYAIDPSAQTCSDQTGDTTAGDNIQTGQQVVLQAHIKPNCTGTLSGTVAYIPNVGPGGSNYPTFSPVSGRPRLITVGRFSVTIH